MNAEILTLMEKMDSGPVSQEHYDEVLKALASIWSDIDYSGLKGMDSTKLGRAEDLHWDPPILTFRIERHGAMAMGSSRAELQSWSINLATMAAVYDVEGYRQIRPLSGRYTREDAQRHAVEVAQAIREGRDEVYLCWSKDRRSVRVKARGLLYPDGPKETITARGRRLNDALADVLEDWERRGTWWRRRTH